nr:DR2241 family protein [Halogeometricum limi]
MRAEQFESLVRRVEEEPVDFDGLYVAREDDSYAFETPDGSHDGLSEAGLHEAAADAAPYVTNWYYWEEVVGHRGRHRRAFLRKLEAADEFSVGRRYDELRDGMHTEWGQLRITATLGDDGDRRYEVRHEADEAVDAAELDEYTDPLNARELATSDERGRYRPLKTAPTLVDGWVFPALDGRDLVETVDTFYPATVANWNLEREGELDVSHWEETIERQTGIYGVVKTWNRGEGHEHVNWVAEACCDDSQCLKRREWQYDENTELDVDGGDGAFPCREPCSVVIAASRKWTRLEGEQSRTYEFDLTPSEKEQVEAIIDAVADGRVDDIREADIYEGANRYRTRFLRAKRFDEDGNLSGTPTDAAEDGDGGEDDE